MASSEENGSGGSGSGERPSANTEEETELRTIHDSNDNDDNAASSSNMTTTTTTTTATVAGAGAESSRNPAERHYHRISQSQQRTSILLHVLFHHMLNSRRRRRLEQEERAMTVTPPPLPPGREMAILSHEEAVATDAMCRFCFEGSVPDETGSTTICTRVDDNDQQQNRHDRPTDNTDKESDAANDNDNDNNNQDGSSSRKTKKKRPSTNSLVAPCNCAGGSRWVHLECLRQWQRLQARSLSNSNLTVFDHGGANASATTTYTAAGYICNVCNSPYLSRPPAVRSIRRDVLKRGTLLVSKLNAVGRTFHQTVILLLTDVGDNNPHGPFGLIVNAPLQQELMPGHAILQRDQRPVENNNLNDNSNQQEQQQQQQQQQQQHDNNTNTTNNNAVIEWRRGGPVCGGRLGVVSYCVLHTYPPSTFAGDDYHEDALDVDIDEEYFDENDQDEENHDPAADDGDGTESDSASQAEYDVGSALADDTAATTTAPAPMESETNEQRELEETGTEEADTDDEGDLNDDSPDNHACVPLSLPVFDEEGSFSSLQYVASPDSFAPSTLSEDDLGHAIQRLVFGGEAREQPDMNQSTSTANPPVALHHQDNNTPTITATTSPDQPKHKVIVFSGYCKWRAGQLEREIQREVWDVCIDATPEDILRHHSSGFWEEITESNRLLSWQRLMEEGESDAED